MADLAELRETFRARPVGATVNLAGHDSAETPFVDSKSEAKGDLAHMRDRLFDLHELMFAAEEESVLLVLQGLDCSGKGGTIKHVVSAVNPAGVRTVSFVEPTKEEQEHHFLWRYRNALPGPGQLGVFDRSHYEDAVVPMATSELPTETVDERIDEINAFERELIDNGTRLVKCMLHISYDEQRERFLRRLRRHDKRWKFSPSDIETRRLWNEYQAAYGAVIGATSNEDAPWLIIPADHKWYRNWAVARLLIETFETMGGAYPQPDFDIEEMRRQLEPPN